MKRIGYVFLALGCVCGVFTLGVFLWQVYGTDIASRAQHDHTIEALRKQWQSGVDRPIDTQPPAVNKPAGKDDSTVVSQPNSTSTPSPDKAQYGKAFGIIQVPRFGSDYEVPIIYGTDASVLSRGVGHYDGTAYPCQVGNVGLAGHRTTYGRPFHNVDQLQRGDKIEITTATTSCVYEYDSYEIVDPSAIRVIAPVPNHPGKAPHEAWLTLTSCHPKYSAAKRYVVHAKLIED
ncbi:class E sortase [Candidatus Saccharibacteria bacterium]|nr:MAG: class E sortase [Candidatus Saccharibacteria bacterium]